MSGKETKTTFEHHGQEYEVEANDFRGDTIVLADLGLVFRVVWDEDRGEFVLVELSTLRVDVSKLTPERTLEMVAWELKYLIAHPMLSAIATQAPSLK